MAEEKTTKRALGIVIAVVVVVVCVTFGWFLVTSNMPVMSENAIFTHGRWDPLYGYSGSVELTFRNTARTTAKGVVAQVIVTDQSGETEAVESITIGDMEPGEVAKKSVFVDYENGDTDFDVEVTTIWSTWFWGQKTYEGSHRFVL